MLFPSCKTTLIIISLIISVLVTIVSVILINFVVPDLINNRLHERLRLENGTEQYDQFVNVPFPTTFSVYLFNIENPEGVLQGEKPILRQVGPYVYKQYRTRIVEGVDDEEDTISFREKQIFYFDRDASGNLSDEDNVTTANIIVNNYLQQEENSAFRSIIYGCIPDIFQNLASPLITVKVKDLLFDGLKFCSKHWSFCHLLCKVIKNEPNIVISQDGSLKVALLSSGNKSNTVFTMKRGFTDVHSLGQIVKVNNSKYTHIWDSLGPESRCDNVEGTHLVTFPPAINSTLPLKIFADDFCRSFESEFLKEDVYRGLKSYTFASNSLAFKSSFEDKSKDCFCSKLTPDINGQDSCYLDGVFDIKRCTGANVLLSPPHFLWADPSYLQGVQGLSPDEEIHKSFITIQPDTGTPLQAHKRIQINTVLRPYHAKGVRNVTRVVLPIFWVDEGFQLPDEYINKLHDGYFNKVLLIYSVLWALLGGGILSTVIIVAYLVARPYLYLKS